MSTGSLTHQDVRDTLATYIRAWEQQDPELITTIFSTDATYHERVLGEPIRSHDGIRAYWQSKIVESQANIRCRLMNLYLDGMTAVAEWEAEFDDTLQGIRKRIREIAVLEFQHGLITSLREYWASEIIDALDGHLPS